MSDKRFEVLFYGDVINCVRDESGKEYNLHETITILNEQQDTIDKLEQRDYYNQSERYTILCRAIELTANYIDNSDEEHYDFCALVTEFEKELLDDE